MLRNLYLLTDSNSKFLISTSGGYYHSMNLERIVSNFKNYGFSVKVIKYSELKFDDNFENTYVLYHSSEDPGQFYKRYIEDIIYFLEQKGAIVLPSFKYLKAHHNKGFMELLRYNFKSDDLKTIKTNYFGYDIDIQNDNFNYPLVVKQCSGSGSSDVYLARNYKELVKYVKKISNAYIFNSLFLIPFYIFKNIIKKIMNSLLNKKYLINIYKVNRPYIFQNFIDKMPGDFKVLYFSGKYYSLYRKNRKNDFRASGSGLIFEVPDNLIYPLLNFAESVVSEINFPIIGMDIGFDGVNFHLIEFQMIHIGPITLERSKYFYSKVNNDWIMFESSSNLEDEFCRSIYEFIISKN